MDKQPVSFSHWFFFFLFSCCKLFWLNYVQMPFYLRGNKHGGDYKWLAEPAKVQVCVLEGVHGDSWEGHRSKHLAQTHSKAHLAQIGRTPMKDNTQCHDANGVPYECSPQPAVPEQYTYVALYLGGLWIEDKHGVWWRTSNTRYHVTLGYLPGMVGNKRWILYRDLHDVCSVWLLKRGVPLQRPLSTEILWVRHCQFNPVPEEIAPYCPPRTCPVIDFATDDLRTLVTEENIALSTPAGNDKDLIQALLEFHNRDTKRRAEATHRANLLTAREPNEPIQVRLSSCHVVQGGEMHDLLEYLLARLSFKHAVWYIHPRGEIGLHHAGSWHVSIEEAPQIVELRPPWYENVD